MITNWARGCFDEQLQASGFKVDTGAIVESSIIGAPGSTKNIDKAREPGMRQNRKAQQWYLAIKLRIGADSQSDLANNAVLTAAKVHDKHALPYLLHGSGQGAHGDASQKDLLASKAVKAKDLTRRRPRYANFVNQAVRARNRNESRIGHVLSVTKRLWGFGTLRFGACKRTLRRCSWHWRCSIFT